MLIHSATVSPNCRKIEAFVRHFSLPVEIVQVDMADPITKRPEFLKLNPNGKIPCLVDGDYTLWESNVILTYLSDLHPELSMLPSDARDRASVEKWLAWQASCFGPALGKLFRPDAALVAEAKREVAALSPILDAQLDGRPFVAGKLSVADFALGAYVLIVPAERYDFSVHRHLSAWVTRVRGLAGFVATEPAFGTRH